MKIDISDQEKDVLLQVLNAVNVPVAVAVVLINIINKLMNPSPKEDNNGSSTI